MSDIFFPDVSFYQRGLVIQPGTVFVWARATQGTTIIDDTYEYFKAQAASVNAGFGAYHFLTAGNGAAQADYCFAVVGPGVPLFVDVEPEGTSYPTVADVDAFTARYRALGGLCEVMYYPKWYWTNQGSPDLSVTGLKLIASGTAGYSDMAASWNAYGGVTPFQWQFSINYEYGGMQIDFNAFKGTIDEYLAAIGIPPAPPIPISNSNEDDDMTAASNAQGVAGLSWSTGAKHSLQIIADGALGALPALRATFISNTEGPVVQTLSAWSNGCILLDPIPNVANTCGVVLEAQNGDTTPFFAFIS